MFTDTVLKNSSSIWNLDASKYFDVLPSSKHSAEALPFTVILHLLCSIVYSPFPSLIFDWDTVYSKGKVMAPLTQGSVLFKCNTEPWQANSVL